MELRVEQLDTVGAHITRKLKNGKSVSGKIVGYAIHQKPDEWLTPVQDAYLHTMYVEEDITGNVATFRLTQYVDKETVE